MQTLGEKDLRREIDEFRERFPKLSDDDLFVLWFLRAFVTEDEGEAAEALTGGSGDKGVDAVLLDEVTKTAFVVQGKYRKAIGAGAEKRADV